MIKPFDVTLYASDKKSPHLSLDEIKGIIIAIFALHCKNEKNFTHYTEVGALERGDLINVSFSIANSNSVDVHFFNWLRGESIYKLIGYIQDACEWAANYEFQDPTQEKWEQKYNNKD